MLTLPDYSNYISTMSSTGREGLEQYRYLANWANQQGQALNTTAARVSGRAGQLADATMGTDPRLMANWEQTYMPLYRAQAADASRMITELPRTEEQYAGKYAADTAQAMDAAKASQTRALQSYGLKGPGIASAALDMTSANQRAAAQVAASEAGRGAARTEARNVTKQAIDTGTQIPQIAGQQASLGLAAGNQEINAPESAVSTTAGAYSPALGFYGQAYPYMAQQGQMMSNQYNQMLAGYNAEQNSGGGVGALVGTLAGGVAGSFLGPMGASIGSQVGGTIGSSISKARGGMVYADGGEVSGPNFVPPTASPSKGAITDDVPARLNAGEFVLPKDVVSWMGEEKLQKLIQSTRQKRQQGEIAKPEEGPPLPAAEMGGAIHTMPPRFISEGARA
jgi:hypothetical protein